MADDRLTTTGRPPGTGRAPSAPTAALWLHVRYRLTPWWVKVIVIFAVSRVVTTSLLLAKAAEQGANPWTGAHPGYFDFAAIWDGRWYNIIAVAGYPSTLPVTDAGTIGENAWAFMPIYPGLVRALMLVTGLDFAVVAVFVSTAFALATALMFYRLLNLTLPSETALFAVVLYCFAPLSPILQVAYAESMFAFLLTLSLYLLVTRRYSLLIASVFAMSLTRPGALAFALALGVHVIIRWVKRDTDPFPMAERVASVIATLAAGIFGLTWAGVAALVTGSLTAYTDTELAWRIPYVGDLGLVPFLPWIQGANYWIPNGWGPALLVLAVVLFVAFMFTPLVRRLGVDIRLWVGSFALYILAVFFPQSSTFRILFPVFPLLGAVAQPKWPAYRVLVVAIFIALQVGWIHIAWWVDGIDWTPP